MTERWRNQQINPGRKPGPYAQPGPEALKRGQARRAIEDRREKQELARDFGHGWIDDLTEDKR